MSSKAIPIWTTSSRRSTTRRGAIRRWVYGVSGNVCVKYAVDGLRERDFRVVVISDAIASLPGLPDPLVSPEWTEDEKLTILTLDEFLASVE